MSKVAQVWIEEAKKLEINQAIFLRVANKSEQTDLANALEKEKENFASLDTVHASQLFINKVLKNARQYVVIERKYRTPFVAFLKDTDGSLSKLTIDPERRRQIYLMLKDEKPREEIEDALNGLTEGEIKEFFPEK